MRVCVAPGRRPRGFRPARRRQGSALRSPAASALAPARPAMASPLAHARRNKRSSSARSYEARAWRRLRSFELCPGWRLEARRRACPCRTARSLRGIVPSGEPGACEPAAPKRNPLLAGVQYANNDNTSPQVRWAGAPVAGRNAASRAPLTAFRERQAKTGD